MVHTRRKIVVSVSKTSKDEATKGVSLVVQVVLPDGRTITATVPFDGCQEFSLDTGTQSKQERQQNWHDNPLAVAPMVLGPILM